MHNWFGFTLVDPFQILDHFIQFGKVICVSKARRDVMHLMWLSYSWLIWKERNNMIFNNKISSTHQLLQKNLVAFFFVADGKKLPFGAFFS